MNRYSSSFSQEFIDNIKKASVLITGGTGSFGRALIKELLKNNYCRRIVVYSRDENKQYQMQLHPDYKDKDKIRYFIGDIRDVRRLEMAMQEVDIVVHAAALKHVPAAEYNPFECIHTNVLGAENVVQAALRTQVKKVIALSTDKAASPLNLYGASKLASDKIFVAANNLSGKNGARFAVVRYGNVVGSRGSVVPLFKKLLESGQRHLPITDKRMTRFWITLNDGVNFVLSCLDFMHGGEIFIPKIPSMKIVDVARAMADDVELRVIGIRPGEKIHETMITADDSRNTVELDDRYVIEPNLAWWRHESYLSKGGYKVRDGFRYSSESNKVWLDKQGLLQMLAQVYPN